MPQYHLKSKEWIISLDLKESSWHRKCPKEGSYTKLGNEPKQDERHDLIGFKHVLDTGLKPEEVAEDETISPPSSSTMLECCLD